MYIISDPQSSKEELSENKQTIKKYCIPICKVVGLIIIFLTATHPPLAYSPPFPATHYPFLSENNPLLFPVVIRVGLVCIHDAYFICYLGSTHERKHVTRVFLAVTYLVCCDGLQCDSVLCGLSLFAFV